MFLHAASMDNLDGPTELTRFNDKGIQTGSRQRFSHWGGDFQTGFNPGAVAPDAKGGFALIGTVGCRVYNTGIYGKRCPMKKNAIWHWQAYADWHKNRGKGGTKQKYDRRGSVPVNELDKLYFMTINKDGAASKPRRVFPKAKTEQMGSDVVYLGKNKWLIAYSQAGKGQDALNSYSFSLRPPAEVVKKGSHLAILNGQGKVQGKPVRLPSHKSFPGGTAHLRRMPQGIGWIIAEQGKKQIQLVELKCSAR